MSCHTPAVRPVHSFCNTHSYMGRQNSERLFWAFDATTKGLISKNLTENQWCVAVLHPYIEIISFLFAESPKTQLCLVSPRLTLPNLQLDGNLYASYKHETTFCRTLCSGLDKRWNCHLYPWNTVIWNYWVDIVSAQWATAIPCPLWAFHIGTFNERASEGAGMVLPTQGQWNLCGCWNME